MSKQKEIREGIWQILRNSGLHISEADDALETIWNTLHSQGVVIKIEGELPLSKMEIFLQEHNDLELIENGERIRHIAPYYPHPTQEYPVTKLHLEGEVVARQLQNELDAQQDMLKAGYVVVEPLIKEVTNG